jgi:DNA-binding response OmpR family regulator
MKNKILVIDDEISLLKAVKERLTIEKFNVVTFTSAEQAMSSVNKDIPDLMIVDVRLGGMSGFDFCRTIRSFKGPISIVPIIFLTTAKDESSKVLGLELGGDDYLTKPFSTAELVARVRALLRRISRDEEEGDDVVSSGKLVVNKSKHEALFSDKKLELSPKEFNLLYMLLKKKGRVLTRSFLLESVWGIDADVNTRTIDTHVKKLRRILGSLSKNIETVEGLGYKWEE